MMIIAPILRQPKTDYFLCTVVLTLATDLKYNNSGMNNNPNIMLENNQTILLIKKIHKYKWNLFKLGKNISPIKLILWKNLYLLQVFIMDLKIPQVDIIKTWKLIK
jgi:hypothetical protein